MTEKQLSAYISELLIEFSHGSQYTNVYLFADKWAKRIYDKIATAPKDALVAGQKREHI